MVYSTSGSRQAKPSTLSTAVSALLTPLGVLALFSFGGQIVFGPFVLAIEWILARVAARPVRVVWCVLAGALGGEFVYLVFDLRVDQIDGFLAIVFGLLASALVTSLYLRTTRPAA
jgi:hypothetical protein